MSTRAKTLWLLGIVVAVLVAVSVNSVWKRGDARRTTAEIRPLPPIVETEYLNIGDSAAYVGAETCLECHSDEHQSWMATAHGRVMMEVDASDSPPPGEFDDPQSGRHYEIAVVGDELRHRETVIAADGQSVVLADLPVLYTIGAGTDRRSYMVDREGFLVQSPATWYGAMEAWGLSPGYDQYNPGFERPMTASCLGCHAGRIERIGESVQEFTIASQAIDCERCHGPGSLHVESRRAQPAGSNDEADDEPDLTIVNPADLPREAQVAVCAQCHEQSAATIDLRGRSREDFRPGQRLNDFCIHYAFENPYRELRVFGHVEQLQSSPCYLGSQMTCTTCHDSHASAPVDSGERTEHFLAKCLDCHTVETCGIPQDIRVAEFPNDNCLTCHMPASATEVPHVATTHHQIGIHRPPEEHTEKALDILLPLDDISRLQQIDRDRTGALAYVRAAETVGISDAAAALQQRAFELMESVRERGLSDPDLDAALAEYYRGIDPERSIELAEAVLQQTDVSPESRVDAMFALAATKIQQRDIQGAQPLLEELVKLRLSSEDWFLLSLCREELQDASGALEACERACELSPQYPDLQDRLANLYEASGQTAEAEAARQRAEQLRNSSLILPDQAPEPQSANP